MRAYEQVKECAWIVPLNKIMRAETFVSAFFHVPSVELTLAYGRTCPFIVKIDLSYLPDVQIDESVE